MKNWCEINENKGNLVVYEPREMYPCALGKRRSSCREQLRLKSDFRPTPRRLVISTKIKINSFYFQNFVIQESRTIYVHYT